MCLKLAIKDHVTIIMTMSDQITSHFSDDDLVGQVTNALIACTEPKQCSATLLKSYLIEYHPEFDIQNKPYLFKKALERALKKNIIR